MSFDPVRGGDGRILDVIEIASLDIECIVGVYPSERDTPQPLVVDLSLYLDTRRAGTGGALKDTIDYARLSGELRFLLQSCRFLLLETAADALCRYMLAPPTDDRPHPPVAAVRLRLTKPRALGGRAQPTLEVFRSADEIVLDLEDKPFGRVDIIHVSRGCGIYRLRVAPGRTITTHVHRAMDENELVLGAGLVLQGAPVRAGLAYAWPKGVAHRYDNPSDVEQTILCVDRPAFIPTDEVEVPMPEAGFELPPAIDYYGTG